MALVDESGFESVGGEIRASDEEVAFRRLF
jgi:hypothetical protein